MQQWHHCYRKFDGVFTVLLKLHGQLIKFWYHNFFKIIMIRRVSVNFPQHFNTNAGSIQSSASPLCHFLHPSEAVQKIQTFPA